MAFTQELEASSCKICRDVLTTMSKHNCLVCRLPCGHTYLHSFEKSNKDYGGGSEDQGKSDKNFLEVGFWGGSGGKSWDDGFFDGVRAIMVQFGGSICSIQVTYDKDGVSVKGEKHGGGGGGDSSAVMELDYPSEYIVRVSGHISLAENKWLVVRSLTFETNKRAFGPYGKTEGLSFTFPLVGMKIAGSKGRSGSLLDAIGFHVSTDTSSNSRSLEELIMSTREMIEELLVYTRQTFARNLAVDDGVSAASGEF